MEPGLDLFGTLFICLSSILNKHTVDQILKLLYKRRGRMLTTTRYLEELLYTDEAAQVLDASDAKEIPKEQEEGKKRRAWAREFAAAYHNTK